MIEVAPLVAADIDEIATRLLPHAEMLAGKHVVITGGRGFIGRYLVGVLERLSGDSGNPIRVTVLDNHVTGSPTSPESSASRICKFVEHDVVEPISFDEKVDFVIHAAGIASPFYYRAYPLETLEVATTGTKNLLNVARDHHARFLFMSSSEIYGDPHPDHVPTPESYRGSVACQGPRACYDEGKRVGETYCYIYNDMYGVATTVVRPFNVFGPGMSQKDYRVLPNFASNIRSGKALRIYGTGNQTRTYCYVTDAIVGFFKALLLGVPGEPYNIGNRSPETSVPDLAKSIEKVLDRPIEWILTDYPDSYPADEPTRRCPDVRKALHQLDFEAEVGLEDGLRRFFEWTEAHYAPEE